MAMNIPIHIKPCPKNFYRENTSRHINMSVRSSPRTTRQIGTIRNFSITPSHRKPTRSNTPRTESPSPGCCDSLSNRDDRRFNGQLNCHLDITQKSIIIAMGKSDQGGVGQNAQH
jgi:hypothetical protein